MDRLANQRPWTWTLPRSWFVITKWATKHSHIAMIVQGGPISLDDLDLTGWPYRFKEMTE